MEHHDVTGQRLMAEADSMANSTQVSIYILLRCVEICARPLIQTKNIDILV